jgi:superoxide dismutase, Fe-Mn family
MVEKTAKITQTPLPYALGALAPVMSELQMDYHFNKHHKTYVTKYNESLDSIEDALQKQDFARIARLAKNTKFFGGGNWNHTFFWEGLSPVGEVGGQLPAADSDLAKSITSAWGSIEKFIAEFNAETAAIQGSGWGWLVYNPTTGGLEYRSSFNQDLITEQQPAGLVPLLNIDIWEHAFYIDYKSAKPDFLAAIWKVVNWKKIEQRLADAKKTAGRL